MQLPAFLGLLFATAQETSGQVTEAPGVTVTYNPGQECLPYDGSVVPDCTLYVDPVIKEPYYKEHSTNCSRFWECGPNFETCLVECAHCGDESNQQCHYHEDDLYMPALAFDVSKQFPDGPVCNWPSDTTLRCHGCPEDAECCRNDDCGSCGHCNLDWTCSYPDDCCTSDSDCAHSDGMCNVPAPHTPDNCAYCDNNGKCAGGCANLGDDSVNCPGTHPNCNSHVCEESTCPPNAECCDDSACDKCPGGHCNLDTFTCSYPGDCCTYDSDCDNYDGMCNIPAPHTPDNCAYCDNKHCTGGCANLGDDSVNCPGTHPNCNSHVCEEPTCPPNAECCDDSACDKCPGGQCNLETFSCSYPDDCCTSDSDCDNYDGMCNMPAPHTPDNCAYCDNKHCTGGCADLSINSINCPATNPICNPSSHICGAPSGVTVLTEMGFTSDDCVGCDKEGVNMILIGSDTGVQHNCTTVNLDHPEQTDFQNNAIFSTATDDPKTTGWGDCWEAPLKGKVSAATVTWTGTGTWSPNNICFDWSDPESFVTICSISPGTLPHLTNGDSVSLQCSQKLNQLEC